MASGADQGVRPTIRSAQLVEEMGVRSIFFLLACLLRAQTDVGRAVVPEPAYGQAL